MILALLALALQASPEVRVLGPGKPNDQTPATLMVEPAAMFVVACDRDEDGRVTRVELDACVGRSFAVIDTGKADKIGYIAYADWQKRWLGDQGALPSPLEVDRDGDDRVSAAELQAHFAKLFARYDKDRDGVVTRAEALTIRANASGPRPPRRTALPGAQRVPGGQPEEDAPSDPK